jgi:hypothetical protein
LVHIPVVGEEDGTVRQERLDELQSRADSCRSQSTTHTRTAAQARLRHVAVALTTERQAVIPTLRTDELLDQEREHCQARANRVKALARASSCPLGVRIVRAQICIA